MMKLSQLLEQIEYTCVQGGLDKEIKSVVYDSRKVELYLKSLIIIYQIEHLLTSSTLNKNA